MLLQTVEAVRSESIHSSIAQPADLVAELHVGAQGVHRGCVDSLVHDQVVVRRSGLADVDRVGLGFGVVERRLTRTRSESIKLGVGQHHHPGTEASLEQPLGDLAHPVVGRLVGQDSVNGVSQRGLTLLEDLGASVLGSGVGHQRGSACDSRINPIQ